MVMHWSRKKNKRIWQFIQVEQKKTHTHNNAITLKKWIKTPSKALKLNKEQKHSKMPSSWLWNKNTWQCIQTEQIIETPNYAFKPSKKGQVANQTTKTHDNDPNKTIVNTCQALKT
jgi:hypothetical protein